MLLRPGHQETAFTRSPEAVAAAAEGPGTPDTDLARILGTDARVPLGPAEGDTGYIAWLGAEGHTPADTGCPNAADTPPAHWAWDRRRMDATPQAGRNHTPGRAGPGTGRAGGSPAPPGRTGNPGTGGGRRARCRGKRTARKTGKRRGAAGWRAG